MINLEDKFLKMLKDILKKYPYTFYAFGSRVQNKNRKFSDLDLCYKDKIPSDVISNLKEELEESNLPFRVDIIDWNTCKPNFKKLIEKDLTLIS